MGLTAAGYQPLVRRPYEQHPRPHLQHLPLVLWPANDGCTEHSLDRPYRLLPFIIPLSS